MATPMAPAHADVPPNVIRKDDVGATTGWFSSKELYVSMAAGARSTGIAEAIQPLNELRNNALHDHPEQTAEILREYDRVLGKTLNASYGAFAAAVRNTAIPFAEIDSTGRVVYANDALLAFAPSAIGQPFSDLFSLRASEVRTALQREKGASLSVEMTSDGRTFSHLRVAVVPMQDESGARGAFAVLLNTGADDCLYESAPEGVIRLNNEGTITFANTRANALLGVERLIGLPAAAIFHAGNIGDQRLVDVRQWLQRAEGHKEIAEFACPDSQVVIPVRASILPSYHSRELRAGTIVAFSSRAIEIVREEVQRLVATVTDPHILLRGVMQAIGSIVPYDLATFGVYNEDMTLWRALASDPDQFQDWKIRWFQVDETILPWLEGGKSWAEDLAAFVNENAPSADRDTLQRVLEQGLQSLLTFPIRKGPGQFRSSLSLLRVGKGRYDEGAYTTLQLLGLNEALIAAETAFDRWRDDQKRKLKHDLARARGTQQLASVLATGIAECFAWDYVSVLEVDRLAGCFRLVAQHDASPDQRLRIPNNYTQPIDQGMLHAVLSTGDALIIPDTTVEPRPYGYMQIVQAQSSSMVVPVRVAGHIEWMIDVESFQRNAFRGPDLDDLREIVQECEGVLNRRWQASLRYSLLNMTEQAVVITDHTDHIRLANERAGRIFGTKVEALLDTPLTVHFIDSSREALRTPFVSAPTEVTIQRANGELIPAILTELMLSDDYGHRLFGLVTVSDSNWERDWRYLDETVSAVAQHTQVPLLLAARIIRKMLAEQSLSTHSNNLLDSALKQLSKANLTYERMINALKVYQSTDDTPAPFDAFALLQKAVSVLPEGDKDCIVIEIDPALTFVLEGNEERLSFAFRSLLVHLLVLRAPDGRVILQANVLSPETLRVTARLEGTNLSSLPSVDESNPLSVTRDRARQNVGLAPDCIQAIVSQHGGTFEYQAGKEEFVITLHHR